MVNRNFWLPPSPPAHGLFVAEVSQFDAGRSRPGKQKRTLSVLVGSLAAKLLVSSIFSSQLEMGKLLVGKTKMAVDGALSLPVVDVFTASHLLVARSSKGNRNAAGLLIAWMSFKIR